MLFNSFVFLKFFAAFLLLYWLVRHRLAARNLLIVAASYLFYGWWDYRFLSLLLISSLLDYGVGLALARTTEPRQRKAWLGLSLAGNLTILGFFKYYDFFVASFASLLDSLGVPFHPRTLGVILPVGISFYTFQTMSYVIDVYRGELPASRNVVNFLAYVSFFPQLVAGPIERAKHLLPQFEQTRRITRPMLEEGVWLMLWGMFKKVALADNVAPLVELAFGAPQFSAPVVLFGTVAFAIQIYCDFSGYSDLARGLARVLGFDIMVNFNIPYAATSVREFWRRWHISLSTWLRDYLYIPLGGNRRGPARTYVNLLLTMVLGGLWHGAAWHFVLWGAWHGGGLMLHRGLAGEASPPAMPAARFGPGRWLGWTLTMLFVLYGWLLFRAESVEQIARMTVSLVTFSGPPWVLSFGLNLLVFTAPLILVEWWQARTGDHLAPLGLPGWARGILQGLLLVGILLFWHQEKTAFIYFQF